MTCKCEHFIPIEVDFPNFITAFCSNCKREVKFENLSITKYEESFTSDSITIENVSAITIERGNKNA